MFEACVGTEVWPKPSLIGLRSSLAFLEAVGAVVNPVPEILVAPSERPAVAVVSFLTLTPELGTELLTSLGLYPSLLICSSSSLAARSASSKSTSAAFTFFATTFLLPDLDDKILELAVFLPVRIDDEGLALPGTILAVLTVLIGTPFVGLLAVGSVEEPAVAGDEVLEIGV